MPDVLEPIKEIMTSTIPRPFTMQEESKNNFDEDKIRVIGNDNEFNDSIEENNNVIYNTKEKKDNANDNGSIVDNENIKKEKKEK